MNTEIIIALVVPATLISVVVISYLKYKKK